MYQRVCCHFKHPGFPKNENRCLVCGAPGHELAERLDIRLDCKAPGGRKDTKRQESLAEHRKRREASGWDSRSGKPPGKPGNGQGPRSNCQGKGDSTPGSRASSVERRSQPSKAKPKPKPKGKFRIRSRSRGATARAARFQLRAAAAGSQFNFPRDGIGLDSCANVQVIRQRPSKSDPKYDETMKLVYGEFWCYKDIGRKGTPCVFVPWVPKDENVDLCPEGWLQCRGVDILKRQKTQLVIPKGSVIDVKIDVKSGCHIFLRVNWSSSLMTCQSVTLLGVMGVVQSFPQLLVRVVVQALLRVRFESS